jgi:hypothetical protein
MFHVKHLFLDRLKECLMFHGKQSNCETFKLFHGFELNQRETKCETLFHVKHPSRNRLMIIKMFHGKHRDQDKHKNHSSVSRETLARGYAQIRIDVSRQTIKL